MKETDQLKQARLELEATLESIGDGLIVTDQYGQITKINARALELLGYKEGELKGKWVTGAITVFDQDGQEIMRHLRPMAEALTSGQRVSQEVYYQRKDGSIFPVSTTVTPILADDHPIGAIEIFRDISREKELEQMKDEFVSVASHELRTPMTAVKGLTSMILNGDYGPVNEGLRSPLKDISTSTERLIHLVNDLLNLSRITAKRMRFEVDDLNLAESVAEIVKSLQPLAQKKNIKLVNKIKPEITIQSDPDKVSQIMTNLIGNALKFTDKGSITIESKRSGQLENLYVRDTGVGIAKEQQSQLFQRFTQVTQEGEIRPAGTGLGLYISRELARKMGGDVWLDSSTLQKGSIFAVSFPRSNSALAIKIKRQLLHEKELHPNQKPFSENHN